MSQRPSVAERRFTSRIPIRVLVQYTHLDDFLADYTANVSLGGMFIGTKSPLDLGTRFRLRMVIPGETRPMHTFGVVRWVVRAGIGLVPGMGIEFDPLRPADQARVERWLENYDG